MQKNSDKQNNDTAEDRAVEKMIETWDIVNCKYCGKEISMLNAKIIHNAFGEYFVCKEHAHE